MTQIKIIYLGDIFGEAGRIAVAKALPRLREIHQPDAIFANAENAAAGRGISPKIVNEFLAQGIDFMTSGNHIFHVKEIYPYLSQKDCRLLRPYNFSKNALGRGTGIFQTKNGVMIGLINLVGNVYMDKPSGILYDAADAALSELTGQADVILVDIHAEATAEKRALAWHLDGKVQLVAGTHTHVLTADEGIMPQGTAFITDLGMCGPYDSIIGMDKESVLHKFRTQMPRKFEPGKNDKRVTGIVCTIDLHTKKAVSIERIDERNL